MKQLELAKKSRVSVSAISKILSGNRRASYELAERLAKLTGTSVELWIKGEATDRRKALKAA